CERSHEGLQLTAHLHDEHLLMHVDVRDSDAMAANNRDKPLPCETLHRLAHGRAANSDAIAQRDLRPQAARRQLERDDQLLELAVRDIGKPIDLLFYLPLGSRTE